MAGSREQLKTVRQVAEDLAVSKPTVRRLIAAGELTAIRIGRSLRVSTDEVEHFVARHRATALTTATAEDHGAAVSADAARSE